MTETIVEKRKRIRDKNLYLLEGKEDWITQNSDFIKTKQIEIGLKDSEVLSELCYFLSLGGENSMMYLAMDYLVKTEALCDDKKILNSSAKTIRELRENEPLRKMLGIDSERLEEVLEELVETDDSLPSMDTLNKPYKKQTDTFFLYQVTGKLFREMTSQKIRANDQVRFIVSLFKYYEIGQYKGEDYEASHFKAVETLRLRSIKPAQ